jgi:hypothetical protein
VPVVPPLLVVGHPTHRRVERFLRAGSLEGWPTPEVIGHDVLLDRPERLAEVPPGPRIVRIESLGQDDGVARRLLRLGLIDARREGRCRVVDEDELARDPPSGFELRAPRQIHYGVERYLGSIAALGRTRSDWLFTTAPDAIVTLFDKEQSAALFGDAGLPVAPSLGAIDNADALFDRMRAERTDLVYVKLRHGSSASGLAVVRMRDARSTPRTVWTTVARRGNRFYNSRRIHRYDRREDACTILDFLLREGARVERALPKARLGSRHLDLRVLVIAGEPVFVVVRASRHPVTNLHLGGRPTDAEAFRARMPSGAWERMMDDCRRAADLLPAFHLGIDVLVAPSLSSHVLLEANAFGDLLNGVVIDGRDTYRYQLHRLRQALSAASPSART